MQSTNEEIRTKQKEFLSELSDFFKKHGVIIQWDCAEGSDTYGIIGENMIISSNYGTWNIKDSGIDRIDIDKLNKSL